MSTVAESGPDVHFVEWAVPLLTEYTAKLKELAQQAAAVLWGESTSRVHGSYGVAVRAEIARRWRYLKEPIEELARQASAVVEEGRVNRLEKVELWLRLAEFEHYLGLAQDYVNRVAALK
jgi:hypothetical protein